MRRWTLIAAVAALALAGCGSSNKESAAKSTATPTATATAASAQVARQAAAQIAMPELEAPPAPQIATMAASASHRAAGHAPAASRRDVVTALTSLG